MCATIYVGEMMITTTVVGMVARGPTYCILPPPVPLASLSSLLLLHEKNCHLCIADGTKKKVGRSRGHDWATSSSNRAPAAVDTDWCGVWTDFRSIRSLRASRVASVDHNRPSIRGLKSLVRIRERFGERVGCANLRVPFENH
jgi:hypothetical protein